MEGISDKRKDQTRTGKFEWNGEGDWKIPDQTACGAGKRRNIQESMERPGAVEIDDFDCYTTNVILFKM